jgi:hypothetical protein
MPRAAGNALFLPSTEERDGAKGTVEPPGFIQTTKAAEPNTHTVQGAFFTATTAVVSLVAGAAALVLFCFDPRVYHFYPLCFFHSTTGLLCPGCGALRAAHQLLHGHLTAAFHYNPMLVAAVPFAAWLGGRFALRRVRHRRVSLGLHPKWLWLVLGAVLVVSVLRNLPGAQFAWLRP